MRGDFLESGSAVEATNDDREARVLGDGWAGTDGELAAYISEQSLRTLDSYRAQPNLIAEHAAVEQDTAHGGYQHRQLFELVQNSADALWVDSSGQATGGYGTAREGGRVEVRLTKNFLYCADDGEPIRPDGIAREAVETGRHAVPVSTGSGGCHDEDRHGAVGTRVCNSDPLTPRCGLRRPPRSCHLARGRGALSGSRASPSIQCWSLSPIASMDSFFMEFIRLHEGKRDDAIAIFRELVHEFPDLFEAYNNLAVMYVEEGRIDDARRLMLDALERHPEAVGYRNLGDIYERLAQEAHTRARELEFDGTVDRESSPEAVSPARHTVESIASAAVGTERARMRIPDGEALPAPDKLSGSASGVQESCVLIGELKAGSAVEDAEQWLRSQGVETLHISRESRELTVNYRVYIPPFESRKSAATKMRELRRSGIIDVAVIFSGALKNAVSLGVYASKTNAVRRAAELERLGYTVILTANNKSVEEYAMIQARIHGARNSLRDAWSSRFPDKAIRHVDCS